MSMEQKRAPRTGGVRGTMIEASGATVPRPQGGDRAVVQAEPAAMAQRGERRFQQREVVGKIGPYHGVIGYVNIRGTHPGACQRRVDREANLVESQRNRPALVVAVSPTSDTDHAARLLCKDRECLGVPPVNAKQIAHWPILAGRTRNERREARRMPGKRKEHEWRRPCAFWA
jgi:hypothetical protein